MSNTEIEGLNAIRDEQNQKLQYIYANPVKAKLVQNPQDWVYSSASNYAEGQAYLT